MISSAYEKDTHNTYSNNDIIWKNNKKRLSYNGISCIDM